MTILLEQHNLDTAVKDGTTTANNSAELTVDEAVTVYTATQALLPGITNTINSLIAAKPKFDKLGVTFITTSNLQTSATDSAALGQAIVAKVPSAYQSFANGIVSQINAEFARAQAVYGKPLFSF